MKPANSETVKYKGKIIALIFRRNLKAGGVKFLTPNEYTLQVGLLEHSKGTKIKEHIHNPKIKYKVDTTQEFLYLEKGKMRISFYNNGWDLVAKKILNSGDFMLHVSGGHGFEMLQKCRIIEVKQGPYPGDKIAKIYRE